MTGKSSIHSLGGYRDFGLRVCVNYVHGLAGSANSLSKNVIAFQGKMADAMGFSVERAELRR
jgi:hypothetical protein